MRNITIRGWVGHKVSWRMGGSIHCHVKGWVRLGLIVTMKVMYKCEVYV